MAESSGLASEAPAEGARRQFARHMSAFTLATLSSRILGYVRDAGIAYFFGGGSYTDCYYAAFRIANFLRRTLGEGAMSASFVPVLTSVTREEGDRAAAEFHASLWSGLVLFTAALTSLGIVFARPIVLAMTYGFSSDPGKLALTTLLTRILFPFFVFITAAALAQAALFARRSFFAAALAPTCFSISVLAYLGLLAAGILRPAGMRERVIGLAVAAAAGGLLQWLVLLPGLARQGLLPRPRAPWGHPGVRRVLALLGPSLISVAAEQVDAFVDTLFASFLAAGSITALYNANRLLQLPLALFGISTATVALTHLSDHVASGDVSEYRRTLSDSLALTAFVLLPASAGLLALAGPMVRLLFQHGAFTPEAARTTAGALVFLALGLTAYGWMKVLVMAHYALKDAVTPVRVGVLKVAINVVFCLAFIGALKVRGLTLAASLSSWICSAVLLARLHSRVGLERRLWVSVAKSAGASVLLGLGCLAWLSALHRLGGTRPWIETTTTIGLAVPVYLLLASLFGIEERRVVRRLLKRA